MGRSRTLHPVLTSNDMSPYVDGVARPARNKPREFSPDWPDVPCADPVAEVARQFAVALGEAIDGRPLRAAAAATGVAHTVIHAILTGEAWPDMVTIARLEIGLDASLWPQHRPTHKR